MVKKDQQQPCYSDRLKKYKTKESMRIETPVVCIAFEDVVAVVESFNKGSIKASVVPGSFSFIKELLPSIDNIDSPRQLTPFIISPMCSSPAGLIAIKNWFVGNGFPIDYISKDVLLFGPSKPEKTILFIDKNVYDFKGVFPDTNEILNNI